MWTSTNDSPDQQRLLHCLPLRGNFWVFSNAWCHLNFFLHFSAVPAHKYLFSIQHLWYVFTTMSAFGLSLSYADMTWPVSGKVSPTFVPFKEWTVILAGKPLRCYWHQGRMDKQIEEMKLAPFSSGEFVIFAFQST